MAGALLVVGSASACAASVDDDAVTSTDGVTAPPAAPPSAAVTEPTVATSTPEPVPTTSSTAPMPTRSYDFSAVDPIIDQFVADRDLTGAGLVVVDRDDGIVHEQYWGDIGPDRISLIASASKMIVAGVLLRLDDQGVFDIDAPVAAAVEWGAGNPDITPAQLVSNSSGLVGLAPNPGYGPYICQFLVQGDLQSCAASIFTTVDDDADVIDPDTEFRYGGGQWQVAGAVAEAVSGRSWAELIDETYVEPCGVDSLGFNNHWTQFGPIGFGYPAEFGGNPSGLADTENPNMEGGAYITAPDYAQLLLMHLRGGRCGDVQVLSSEALAQMHGDRIGAVYDGSAGSSGYGMGWWIDRTSGLLKDPGAYGAVPWLDLDSGHGAYLVVEANSATGTALADELFDPVADAIAAGRSGSSPVSSTTGP